MAINKQMKKTPMPEQNPDIRASNFDEVATGYSEEMAVNEAKRCLDCKHRPCVAGCPVNVQIPDFIAQIVEGDYEGAYQTIKQTNSLPAVCGRVCPQESQCELKCVRGIKGEPVAIGRLERFAADYHMAHHEDKAECPKPNGHRVAVVGSGPAGLTCAGDLAKLGYQVTVFEAFHTAGGVLMYGIPEFRLPKSIVQREIDMLRDMGVKIETNMVIGKVLSIDELFEQGYEAVFIGSGAGLPSFLGIPGEGLLGVMSANEFLTRINLMKAYRDDYDTPIRRAKRVAVIGGGNVAMDAARCAKRLGAESVYIVYRRSENEMPARLEEIHHAKEEGIEFCLLTAPVQIHGDANGNVNMLECIKMELGEPDESGRRRPVEIKGSNFSLEVDMVIAAIGNTPNPLIRMTTPGLEANRKGCLIVEENTMKTTRDGVYAGGDIVTGAATVILAMGAGKQAARAIDEYIQS
ncbi:MAG: NADPH-dependent glutamate synthase [Oscillospiraceae bacterium]|jgi:glutamate synthase (NADPH/NADH) small chain|nr:NADPH-dependent glutamate synthase [Oscillospiraceae bacterium]